MIVGQPAEETIDGAKAMLADHLYERFGKPDMIIGLHDTNGHPAGTVGITAGPAMASATSVDVTIRGIGGHGAMPFYGRDPIVLAANYILQIQTLVSRELDPRDSGIVTVGDIHGGTKRNIIPDEVKLELTVRAFSEKSRQTILAGLRQMAIGVATSAGLPPDKMPTITVLEDESTPALYNDPALSGRVKATLQKTLGADKVFDDPRNTASEDVGIFGLEGNKIPVAYFWLGAMYPDRYAAAQAAGKELPGPHTSKFEPDPEPTLETGVKSLTAVAISLLQAPPSRTHLEIVILRRRRRTCFLFLLLGPPRLQPWSLQPRREPGFSPRDMLSFPPTDKPQPTAPKPPSEPHHLRHEHSATSSPQAPSPHHASSP